MRSTRKILPSIFTAVLLTAVTFTFAKNASATSGECALWLKDLGTKTSLRHGAMALLLPAGHSIFYLSENLGSRDVKVRQSAFAALRRVRENLSSPDAKIEEILYLYTSALSEEAGASAVKSALENERFTPLGTWLWHAPNVPFSKKSIPLIFWEEASRTNQEKYALEEMTPAEARHITNFISAFSYPRLTQIPRWFERNVLDGFTMLELYDQKYGTDFSATAAAQILDKIDASHWWFRDYNEKSDVMTIFNDEFFSKLSHLIIFAKDKAPLEVVLQRLDVYFNEAFVNLISVKFDLLGILKTARRTGVKLEAINRFFFYRIGQPDGINTYGDGILKHNADMQWPTKVERYDLAARLADIASQYYLEVEGNGAYYQFYRAKYYDFNRQKVYYENNQPTLSGLFESAKKLAGITSDDESLEPQTEATVKSTVTGANDVAPKQNMTEVNEAKPYRKSFNLLVEDSYVYFGLPFAATREQINSFYEARKRAAFSKYKFPEESDKYSAELKEINRNYERIIL